MRACAGSECRVRPPSLDTLLTCVARYRPEKDEFEVHAFGRQLVTIAPPLEVRLALLFVRLATAGSNRVRCRRRRKTRACYLASLDCSSRTYELVGTVCVLVHSSLC